MTATPHPHIWVGALYFSKMWIRLKTPAPVDNLWVSYPNSFHRQTRLIYAARAQHLA